MNLNMNSKTDLLSFDDVNLNSEQACNSPSEDKDKNDCFAQLAGAINSLVNNSNSNFIKDVRHIEQFTGEGDDVTQVLKLNIFLSEIEEFFKSRNLSQSDKLIIVKQKLSGPAKTAMHSFQPKNYEHIKFALLDIYGSVQTSHEVLLSKLKNMSRKPNENFKQYCYRVRDYATVVASKLECDISDLIIFDPLSKCILSNFNVNLRTQGNVKQSIKNRSFQNLIDELFDIIDVSPEILICSKPDTNKPNNVNNQYFDKQMKICANCGIKGHVVKDCRKPKSFPSPQQFFRS